MNRDDLTDSVISIIRYRGPCSIPQISKLLEVHFYVNVQFDEIRAVCLSAVKRKQLVICHDHNGVSYKLPNK